MTTVHDDELRLLEDARKKIEGDENLTFDDVVQLVFHELKKWPVGSTDAARPEISLFLLAAGRRTAKLIIS